MILNIFTDIWETLVKWYVAYSDFIHSYIPSALGDLVVGLIDIAAVCLLVFLVAKVAFSTKNPN